MSNSQLPDFIQHLLQPSAYPHPAPEVKLVQTHISYVLLAGDFVYKFKKPVNFGFLDFTTLEKRQHFSGQELSLNRRLSPSIYLEQVTVNEAEGKLALNGSGTEVEYGIKMVRMPEERMMANVIRRGELTAGMLDQIVATLVPFYEQAEGGEEIKPFGTARSVSVNVLENFEQTDSFVGCEALTRGQFDAIGSYARSFLGREELFEQRIAAGRIRDCHGDLYSANICLADQVYIFDCIEFNQRFRYCDVASDVAFLAMDLDFHGLPELSEHFINRFTAAASDPTLSPMLNFYKCYRAYVRGKIGLFTAHDPKVDEPTRQGCLAQAARYFKLAQQYAGR
ncbi:MAG: hypothetical protein OEV91_02920 [Desulfobulbaceae bacterium]|nr:hypothetical protein [Desulfobulbaceae bacterium]